MKYGFWINHNGVYYAPGTDVPEGKAPSTNVVEPSVAPQDNTVSPEPTQGNENNNVDNSEDGEDEKLAFTRSDIQKLTKAEAIEVATNLGIEIDEEMTSNDIKGKILAHLGI